MPLFIAVFVVVIGVIMNVRARRQKSQAKTKHQARRYSTSHSHRARRPESHPYPANPPQGVAPQETPLNEPPASPAPAASGGYPGDFEGRLPAHRTYHDELPRSGAVVRTWIPKQSHEWEGDMADAVVLARDGRWLLGAEIAYEAPAPDTDGQVRPSYSLGPADWDAGKRDAHVLTDRIIRLHQELIEPYDAHVRGSALLAVRRQL